MLLDETADLYCDIVKRSEPLTGGLIILANTLVKSNVALVPTEELGGGTLDIKELAPQSSYQHICIGVVKGPNDIGNVICANSVERILSNRDVIRTMIADDKYEAERDYVTMRGHTYLTSEGFVKVILDNSDDNGIGRMIYRSFVRLYIPTLSNVLSNMRRRHA